MTKSRRQKSMNKELKTKGYISATEYLSKADKGFPFDDSAGKETIRRCHKDIVLNPGCLKKGDIVCLVKKRPNKIRRRKLKYSTWKIQYADIANGFIQLGNSDTFDKEGAEENISFIRSHNFPITDVWNLDTVFTLFFLPRLKVFINSTRYGIPGDIYQQYIDKGYSQEEASASAEKEWEDILKRMYEGLTLFVEGEDAHEIRTRIKQENKITNQKQLWDIEHKMEKDAMDLFGKRFFSLWD